MTTAPVKRLVLVVEDDAAMATMLARCLKQWGYGVETAPDGRAAWARLEAGPPVDVLLTDKNLPGMSGVELTRAARRAHPRLVLLMITADASVDSARQSIAAGASGFLVKPFEDLTDLRRELEAAVGRAQQGARAADLTAVSAALHRVGRHGRRPCAVVAGAPSFDRDFLAQLLRDDGLRVATASSTEEARTLVDAETALLLVVTPFPEQALLVHDVGSTNPGAWIVMAGPGGGPPDLDSATNVIWIAA
jgi:CheY-like chemotaxis protein